MQALDLPNLRDAPFRLGVGPAEAVVHRSWRTAWDAVLAAVAGRPGRVGVVGPDGSGKTLLLHALAGALRDQGREVQVADRGGLPACLPDDAVLIVDDADRLDGDALAWLAGRDGPCVLAGSPDLADRLPALDPALDIVALQPLPPDEVARFVAARLAAAGQRRDLLEPDAVLALARLSGGVPRQVNALAGAAVFLAGLDGAAAVAPRHVEEAAAMRDGTETDAVATPPLPPPAASVREMAPAFSRPEAPEPLVLSSATPKAALKVPPRTVIAGGAAGLLVLLVGAVLASYSGGGRPRQEAAVAAPPPRQEAAVASRTPPPAPLVPVPAPRPAPAPASAAPSREASVPPEPASASGPRVVVHYREGEAAEADHLAASLAGQAPRFGRVETREVRGTPRAATIRFFHREDVGAAWDLAATLGGNGGTWQVRNFTSFRPKPRRGTLEVWLP